LIKGLIFKVTDLNGYAIHIELLGKNVRMENAPVVGEQYSMQLDNDTYIDTPEVTNYLLKSQVLVVTTIESIYTIHIT